MNVTKNTNLPIIGMVQHGMQVPTQNGGKRAKELGHFIARIKDDYMQKFLQRFDEQYKGKKYIEIEFVNDNPLTKKYARYNQGGEVCYSIEGSKIGNQKTSNGWKQIQCSNECQYRQKNEQGKCACNRIGWLKFLIPSISTDRVWLMRITGQRSINRLDTYLDIQKAQNESLKGRYILFLKQEEQTSKFTGQKFNNIILDIIRKEDFLFQQTNPQKNENVKELSTANAQNVNNSVSNQEHTNVVNKVTTITQKETKTKETSSKKSSKKETKSKTKKTEPTTTESKSKDTNNSKDFKEVSLENCYYLLETFKETIANKEYLIAKVADMSDKISTVVIRPEDAIELEKCDLGTVVKLEISEIKGRKFAIKLEFIQKALKKVAA